MKPLETALRPVRLRMRLERSLTWGILGMAIGAGAALMLRLGGFLWPIKGLWVLCSLCLLASILLGGLIGFLWPVSIKRAAYQVDHCGLMARVQTALEWEKYQSGEEHPMILLQHQDAQKALEAFDIRTALPLRPRKSVLIIAFGLIVLMVGLGLVPNPQHEVLQSKAIFKQEMGKQAALVEEGAGKLETTDPKENQESRKILGDLARDLRKADSPREALSALDQAQRKLENLWKNDADTLRNELANQGKNDLVSALEKGDAKDTENALKAQGAHQLAQSLTQAAQQTTSSSVQQALSQAAQAVAEGNLSQAQMALNSILAASSGSPGQAAALIQMARNATARAGQAMGNAVPGSAAQALVSLGLQAGSGQGSGSGVGSTPGQGAGGGAGKGSTNLDAGYQNHSGNPPVQGNTAPKEKVGVYEAIYDPTRLDREGELTRERGDIGDGETTQAQLGPGLGSVDENVPYPQVALEYSQSAVQAVENAKLPTYAQKWVESYFASLLE